MKKFLSLFMAILMVAAFVPVTVQEVAADNYTVDGSGNWHIYNSAGLESFRASGDTFSGKTVYLEADITMPASGWTGKSNFSGTFDGQGHKIIGLTGSQGLFSAISSATIRNLSIVGATITSTSTAVAAFAGQAGSSTFINCRTDETTTVTSSKYNIAAFVGSRSGGTLTFQGCWFAGKVEATGNDSGNNYGRYISGFLGNNQHGPVVFENCLSTGTVKTAFTATYAYVAQFAGAVYKGSFTATNCLAAGSIEYSQPYSGALSYYIEGAGTANFTNCYALTGSAGYLGYGISASIPGQVEWVAAGSINSTLGALSGYQANWGWKYKTGDYSSNGYILVPKCFADADITVVGGSPAIGISDYSQLAAWATNGSNDSGMTIALTADVDANPGWLAGKDDDLTIPDNVWTPKAQFNGTFDGQGHTISGLYYNTPAANSVGFISLANGATIKNLSIVNSYFNATIYVGSFIGRINGGAVTVDTCYSNAIIVCPCDCGGIVGDGGGTSITFNKCWYDGFMDVTDDTRYSSLGYAGGIIGNQESTATYITDCLYTGTMVVNTHPGSGVTNNQSSNVAGLSPAYYKGGLTITRSVSLGSILNENFLPHGWGFACTSTSETDGSRHGSLTIKDSYLLDASVYTPMDGRRFLIDSAPHFNMVTRPIAGSVYANSRYCTVTLNYSSGSPAYSYNATYSTANSNTATLMSDAVLQSMCVGVLQMDNSSAYNGLDFTASTGTWQIANGRPELRELSAKARTKRYINTYLEYYEWSKLTYTDGYTSLNNDLTMTYPNVDDTRSYNGYNCLESLWANKLGGCVKTNLYGTLDGAWHCVDTMSGDAMITNLYGTVKNLAVLDSGFTYATVAQWIYDGARVENVYSNATLSGNANNIGGMASSIVQLGSSYYNTVTATFTNCWFDGTAAVRFRYVGGILGNQQSQIAVIEDCVNTGRILSREGKQNDTTQNLLGINVGGISPAIYHGKLTATRCVNLGPVYAQHATQAPEVFGTGAIYCFKDSTGTVGTATLSHCYSLSGSANYTGHAAAQQNDANVTVVDERAILSILDDAEFSGWASFKTSDGRQAVAPGCFANFSFLCPDAERTFSTVTRISDAAAFVSVLSGQTVAANTKIVLDADIDLSGRAFAKISGLGGVLDGNGHTVSNVNTIEALIDRVYETGVVKDLSITSSTFTRASVAITAYVGSAFKNVYSNAAVTATLNTCGGLVASLGGTRAPGKAVTFDGCWYDGAFSTNSRYASGMVGNQQSLNLVFNNCLFSGTFTSTYTAAADGTYSTFSGSVYSGKNVFNNCLSTGTLNLSGAHASQKASVIANTINTQVRGGVTVYNCYGLTDTTGRMISGRYTVQSADDTVTQYAVGTTKEILASDYAALAAKLGDTEWGYKNGVAYPVPAAFADELTVDVFRDGASPVSPERSGKKFAGWYEENTYINAIAQETTTGAAFAKFVDEKIMNIKAQTKAPEANGKYKIRFMSTIDISLDYSEVGLVINANGRERELTMTKVYRYIWAAGDRYSASQVSGCEDSCYVTFGMLSGIPAATNADIAVRAFWTTADGTRVYGDWKTYHFNGSAETKLTVVG